MYLLYVSVALLVACVRWNVLVAYGRKHVFVAYTLLVVCTRSCTRCMCLLRMLFAYTGCMRSLHVFVACHTWRLVFHVASCLSRGVLFKPLSH